MKRIMEFARHLHVGKYKGSEFYYFWFMIALVIGVPVMTVDSNRGGMSIVGLLAGVILLLLLVAWFATAMHELNSRDAALQAAKRQSARRKASKERSGSVDRLWLVSHAERVGAFKKGS